MASLPAGTTPNRAFVQSAPGFHGPMISMSPVRPGNGWRYLFRDVMVGDGHRPAGTPLRAAQDEAGVPPGVWKDRGLAALGLKDGDVVTERHAELLLGEGRHPDADRIERELLAQGKSPAQARRATVLGRPIEHNRSPKTDKAKEHTPPAGLRPDVPAPADGTPRLGPDGRQAPPGAGAVPGHRPGQDAGVAGG